LEYVNHNHDKCITKSDANLNMDTTFDRGHDQLNDVLNKYMNNEINDSDTSSDISSIDGKLFLSLMVPNVRASETVGREKPNDDTTFSIEEDCIEQEERKEEKKEYKAGIEDKNEEGNHNK
jgi:hypothetical protein